MKTELIKTPDELRRELNMIRSSLSKFRISCQTSIIDNEVYGKKSDHFKAIDKCLRALHQIEYDYYSYLDKKENTD